jgi:Sulfotransferase domain
VRVPHLFRRGTLGGGSLRPLSRLAKSLLALPARMTSGQRVVPNTFIIGTQRGGTTSIFRYLVEHPAVRGPRLMKGVHYFDTGMEHGEDWYRSHFPLRVTMKLVGKRGGCTPRVVEACPYYLFHPGVPQRVHDVAPGAKFIVILRDPVDRAISHHAHEVARDFESHDLKEAVALESERTGDLGEHLRVDPNLVSFHHQHHTYLDRGLYAEQLERWLELFDREQFLILFTHELASDAALQMTRVLDFLDLPRQAAAEFPVFNARSPKAVDPAVRQSLEQAFETPNEQLGELLGLSHSPW